MGQYLYFCTSKASKLAAPAASKVEVEACLWERRGAVTLCGGALAAPAGPGKGSPREIQGWRSSAAAPVPAAAASVSVLLYQYTK